MPSVMLFISGASRFDTEFGALFAQVEAPEIVHDPTERHEQCTPLPAALAEALSTREARVAVQEAAANDRAAALALAEKLMVERVAQMELLENRLRDTLALADGAAEADLTRLVSVYERMRPKDVAAVFSEMDIGLAAGFVALMKPEAAAAVMAGMGPDKAYAVSAAIAGRNALVPKE